jgi:hypothetical protein
MGITVVTMSIEIKGELYLLKVYKGRNLLLLQLTII